MLTRPVTRSTRATRPLAAAPLVISMPDGLTLGGVSTWAMRLAASLSSGAGGVPPRQVVLLVHDNGKNRHQIEPQRTQPNVTIERLTGLPSLREAEGDLGPHIAAYRAVIEKLHAQSGRPCVLCPTALGDAYGIAAALCLTHPDMMRVIGWQHSDTAYDSRVLAHYEPILAAIAGVSTRIAGTLGQAMQHRQSDISWVPCGVKVPDDYSTTRLKCRANVGTKQRPLRLIYTGRIEHEQKRVNSLLSLSRHLAELGIWHELVLVGDGPASLEVDAAIERMTCENTGGMLVPLTRRIASVAPDRVAGLLDDADVFVLSSRYEGLSVSMLEAMARGCVPVVTHVASGADDVITHGVNGLLVPVLPDETDDDVGRSLARAVQNAIRGDMETMSRQAWCTVHDRYSLTRHALLVSEFLDRAEASPARTWQASRACAFTAAAGSAGGSGTVPADGAVRIQRVLALLAGRKIVLHGAGRHTIELAGALSQSPATIVAITDDDPAKWGGTLLGWRVVPPAQVSATGASDLVISSWIHSDAVYQRRGVYETQGVRVHRVYGGAE